MLTFDQAITKYSPGESRNRRGQWSRSRRHSRRTRKAYDPSEPRDARGRWSAGAALAGTYENRLPAKDFIALKGRIESQFVQTVKGALGGNDLTVKSSWRKLNNGQDARLEVNIETKDRRGFASAGIWLDHYGNMTLQQHDISLPESERGKGTGGRMVGALAAGFKALGAGESDVHIHVNSNPSFWDAMREKHGGIYKAFDPSEPRDDHGRWADAGNAFWSAVKPHDAALGGDVGHAVDMWVGGTHDHVALGGTGGLMIPAHLENMSRDTLDNAAIPIREAARAAYGDTVQVYRAESGGGPSTGRAGNLYSFTTDPKVAASFAGVGKDMPIISEADIARAEKEFADTGETKVGRYTLRSDGSGGIDLYDRSDNHVTDTESVRAEAEDYNAQAREHNAENAAARAKVTPYTIPTDSIVWATDRFNQKEIIAYKPKEGFYWKGARMPAMSFVQAMDLRKAYDPEEARDAHGEWTSSAGETLTPKQREALQFAADHGYSPRFTAAWVKLQRLGLIEPHRGGWRPTDAGHDALKKAFNPDEARDTKGRWTAVEAAQATSKDLLKIMDKARLENAHGIIDPGNQRNDRLLSTSAQDEWSSEPLELVHDAKDFVSGHEDFAHLSVQERADMKDRIHRELDETRDEIQGHNQRLADGLEKYSQRVDAYAARVKDTLGKVKERIAQEPTTKAFNPDEARDDRGRWTSGGDGVGGGKMSLVQRIMDRRVRRAQLRVDRAERSYEELLAARPHVLLGVPADSVTLARIEQASQEVQDSRRELLARESERNHPVRTALRTVFRVKKGDPAVSFVRALDLQKFDPNQTRDARGRWVADSTLTPDEQGKIAAAVKSLPSSAKFVGTDDTTDDVHEPVNRIKMSSFMPVDTHALEGLDQDKVPDPKVMFVPLKTLTASQNTVRTDALLANRSSNQGMPSVVVVDGKPYVEDGHHRVAAALLAGRSEVKAEVYHVSRDKHFDFLKYSEDQPRDNRGRWTSSPGHTMQTWRERPKPPIPPGGVHNDPPKGKLPKGSGTDPSKRARFWVYDHDWNLINTFKTLASAKKVGLAHTNKVNMPAYLYDSQEHKEARTVTWQPGLYTNREVGWHMKTDADGKPTKDLAWRDTSKEDALVEQYARQRAEWERENAPQDTAPRRRSRKVGKAEFYGQMRKRLEQSEIFVKWSEDEARDEHGRWTSGAGLPVAGEKVSGLTVRGDVPNMGSIGAGLDNYTVMPGIREVPMSAFENSGMPKFHSVSEEARTQRLADQIKENGEINPLIVVTEDHNPGAGPYIMEGGHRFDALKMLGKKTFPAIVVVDHGDVSKAFPPPGRAIMFTEALLKYSPDQPRDARGRFAAGGGGSGTPSKKPAPRATVKTPPGGKISDHARLLEAAIGTPEFERLYEGLKADPSMKTDEWKQLSRAMGMGSSRSKSDAMHHVWYRHQNMVIAAAKARATAGRTAA